MAIGAHLGAKMGQDGTKLANLAPRCAQDGQLGGQDGQLGALLGASWRPVGSWARSCQKWRKPKKRREYNTFEGLLGSWGCSWRLCWLILALCWAMLGHLGAILEQLGDKMRPESAKMIQDSAQERQDETRWRKWAPEGGRSERRDTRCISVPPLKKRPELHLEAQPGTS